MKSFFIAFLLFIFTGIIMAEQLQVVLFKEYKMQEFKTFDTSPIKDGIIDGIKENEYADIPFLDGKAKRNLQILMFFSKYIYMDSLLNILLNFPMKIRRYINKYSLTFNIDVTPNKEKLLIIYTHRF